MLGDPRPAPHSYGGRGLAAVRRARLRLQGSSVFASAQTPARAPRRIRGAGQCVPAARSLGARGMGCAWEGPSRPGGARPAPELGSDRPSQVKPTWRVVAPVIATVWELGASPSRPLAHNPLSTPFPMRPQRGPGPAPPTSCTGSGRIAEGLCVGSVRILGLRTLGVWALPQSTAQDTRALVGCLGPQVERDVT